MKNLLIIIIILQILICHQIVKKTKKTKKTVNYLIFFQLCFVHRIKYIISIDSYIIDLNFINSIFCYVLYVNLNAKKSKEQFRKVLKTKNKHNSMKINIKK